MSRPKGLEKTGGRSKGGVNKRTLFERTLRQKCEDAGLDPFDTLIALANCGEPQIALSAAKELCQYIEPKKRAVELTGQNGGPVEIKALQDDPVTDLERIERARRAK